MKYFYTTKLIEIDIEIVNSISCMILSFPFQIEIIWLLLLKIGKGGTIKLEFLIFIGQLHSRAAKLAIGWTTIFSIADSNTLSSSFKPINSRPFNWIKIAFNLH